MTQAIISNVGSRIMACGGDVLGRKLIGRLQSPHLEHVTVLTYRYHDFDFHSGKKHTNRRGSLINVLSRAAQYGTTIQFVTRDPFGEDPMSSEEKAFWYRGLRLLADHEGVTVKLHRSLHAKVYLVRLEGNRRFFAVGSSNLTLQGMGWRWAECNVVGEVLTDYMVVEKEVARIATDNKVETLDEWERRLRRTPEGLP